LRPTSKAEVSTIAGIRGEAAMSRMRLRPPRSRLAPPVSMTALAEAGLTSATLLGEAAWRRFSARKRMRCSSRQPRPALSTRCSVVIDRIEDVPVPVTGNERTGGRGEHVQPVPTHLWRVVAATVVFRVQPQAQAHARWGRQRHRRAGVAGGAMSRLRIFLVGPLGSVSTNQIRRGYL
jgi:hypothetical protein